MKELSTVSTSQLKWHKHTDQSERILVGDGEEIMPLRTEAMISGPQPRMINPLAPLLLEGATLVDLQHQDPIQSLVDL